MSKYNLEKECKRFLDDKLPKIDMSILKGACSDIANNISLKSTGKMIYNITQKLQGVLNTFSRITLSDLDISMEDITKDKLRSENIVLCQQGLLHNQKYWITKNGKTISDILCIEIIHNDLTNCLELKYYLASRDE